MSSSSSNNEMLVNRALAEAGHKDPFIKDESSLSFAEIIPRIIAERGSILNVTENSLREEIDHEKIPTIEESPIVGFSGLTDNNNNNNATSEISDNIDEENTTTITSQGYMTSEEFNKEKNEILTLLRSALNESSLSLDFISLLISCVRPAAGSISMSPHLKQHVPVGSLNSSVVEIQEIEREARKLEYEKEAKVGQGWKLQSLEYSAKILKESSLRLMVEILKEKEYWNNICKIVKSNEVLIKMNTGHSKDIGVKFGFGDSGSNYFDKGVGILKKNLNNGDVQFQPIRNKNLERKYKIVKVKILKRVGDELKTISETDVERFFQDSISVDDNSIGSEIAKARFYLFEEELFHELVREATTLIPYQVQVINNKIILEINDEMIEIEAVSLEDYRNNTLDQQEQEQEQSAVEMMEIDTSNNTGSSSSMKADYISSFLRLMLSQDHKQNITRKFKTPRPLRQDQRHLLKLDMTNSPALLLRPLIGHSKHNHYIKHVRKICQSLVNKYYPQEKEELNVEEKEEANEEEKEEEKGSKNTSINVVKYINIQSKEYEKNKFLRCTRTPNSKIIFQISSPKDQMKELKFEISILNTENFCNVVMNVKSYLIVDKQQQRKLVDANFSEFIDVEDSLDWVLKTY